MSNEQTQKLLEAESACHDKIEALRKENKLKEDKWAQDTESLRQQKDARIRSIEREKEDQRSNFELKINELEGKVRSKCSRWCVTGCV